MALADRLPPADNRTVEERLRDSDSPDPAPLIADEDDDQGVYALTAAGMPNDVVPVIVALARARADMPLVRKRDRFDGGEKGGKFLFRGVDRVVNATRPVLNKHGIVIWPQVLKMEVRDVPRQGGGRSHETILTVQFHVYGPAGDPLPAPLIVTGESLDTSDKDGAKALSVAWREALVKLLHIATGDPDPDSVMIERGEPEFDANGLRDEALDPDTTPGRLAQIRHTLRSLGKEDVRVINEVGDSEAIAHLVWRVGQERGKRNGG